MGSESSLSMSPTRSILKTDSSACSEPTFSQPNKSSIEKDPPPNSLDSEKNDSLAIPSSPPVAWDDFTQGSKWDTLLILKLTDSRSMLLKPQKIKGVMQ